MSTYISPSTSLADAGKEWLAQLTLAGIDDDLLDDDDLDEAERRERDTQRHHARRTIESYGVALRLFLRWCARQGKQRLADLQGEDLVSYVRLLRRRGYDLSERAQQAAAPDERLTARTVHSYSRPLLGFLHRMEQANALSFPTAPLQIELKRVLPRLSIPLAPTPPDLHRLVTQYDRPTSDEDDRTPRLALIRLRNAALLHLLFSSAARISEALSLDVGDVCRDRGVLSRAQVHGKGRKEGTLFIRRPAERALRRYLEARGWPAASSPLFESLDRRTAGGRLTRSSGWRIVTEAAERLANQLVIEGKLDEAASLRGATPHTFRHFVGYHLLNEGVALAEVSQILRHSNLEITRSYYASYRQAQLQEVHDQFSADPLEG